MSSAFRSRLRSRGPSDGRSDEHLWAETYDRKFENALHLQRTVAEQIVASIGARLTPTEDRLIQRSAPTDPEAYAFYLQALSHWSQLATESELRTSDGLLSRALELNSAFALGYALRARVRVWLGTTIEGPNAETDVQGAWLDIERALQLQPELPEALTARASYVTYVERDPMRALRDLDRALTLAPNDADAHDIAGLTRRRLGRFDEAIAHFREAARLGADPRGRRSCRRGLFGAAAPAGSIPCATACLRDVLVRRDAPR